MEGFSSGFSIVIMSRGRADSITTHKIIPDATLVVPESEIAAYAHTGLPIVPIPDEIKGASRVKNWILRRFEEEVLVILDDDISAVRSVVGRHGRLLTKSEIADVIRNTAWCAKEAGATLFGWNQTNGDVRKFRPHEPFLLNSWVSCALGVIGREMYWDEGLIFRSDADFNLRHLLRDRIVWCENRFSFIQLREKNRGGNAEYRTSEKVEREMRILKSRWGQYINFRKRKGVIGLTLSVPRKQAL